MGGRKEKGRGRAKDREKHKTEGRRQWRKTEDQVLLRNWPWTCDYGGIGVQLPEAGTLPSVYTRISSTPLKAEYIIIGRCLESHRGATIAYLSSFWRKVNWKLADVSIFVIWMRRVCNHIWCVTLHSFSSGNHHDRLVKLLQVSWMGDREQ